MWGFLITNMGCLDLDCRVSHWGRGVPCQYVWLPRGGVGFPIKDMGTLTGGNAPRAGPSRGTGADECHTEHLRGGGRRLPIPHGAPCARLPRGPGGRGPTAGRHRPQVQPLPVPPAAATWGSGLGEMPPQSGHAACVGPHTGDQPCPALLPWPSAGPARLLSSHTPQTRQPQLCPLPAWPLPGTHRGLTYPEAHAGRFLPSKTKGTKRPLSVWLCPCHRRACLRLSTEVAWQAWARPAGPDEAWVVFEPRSRGRTWWVSGPGEP